MQKIQITEARKIAERIGADQVVVIAFGDNHFAVTSYGTTKALCAEAGKWIDQIAADLNSGVMAPPGPPMHGYQYPTERNLASGERGGAGGSPMPPRPAQTDGRLDESTSGELARGTDSLRRPQLQTFDANDIGFKLEMSIKTAKELYEIEKNTRSAHRAARDIVFD